MSSELAILSSELAILSSEIAILSSEIAILSWPSQHRLQPTLNLLYTENQYMGTLANSEDPDEIPQNASAQKNCLNQKQMLKLMDKEIYTQFFGQIFI